ncbi:2181_t:CDS:2 [Paraglomus brasilianum]|uniref:2181_t:CDS:1 n=1 Tax=Paraglomus brasilianum TaxID=144538 RepID=A0A9N9BNV5_9GLOM|nr:2181_t:CDS:2 [Paraglomus brasilianum]
MSLQEEGNLENYLIEKAGADIEIKQKATKQIMFIKKRLNIPNSYTIGLYHPYVDSALAEVRSQKYDSRIKHLKLYSPELEIEFRNTGKLGFATEYEFRWQDERYIWRKGPLNKELECKMMPERGPGIGVAIFHPKKKLSQLGIVTVMYFNMDRLDVSDKKGLEYVILISLLSILDRGDGIFTRKHNVSTSMPAQVSPTVGSPREKERPQETKKLEKKSKSDENVATELAEKEAAEANVETEKRIREAREQERRDKELAKRLAELELDDDGAIERQEHNPAQPIPAQPIPAQPIPAQPIPAQPIPATYPAMPYTNDTSGQPYPSARFSMFSEQSSPQYNNFNNRPSTFYDATAIDYSRMTQGFPSVVGNGTSAPPNVYYPNGYSGYNDVRNGGYSDVRNGGYANIYPATADPFSDVSAYTVNSSVYPSDSSSIPSSATSSSAYNYNTHATHPSLAPIITNPAILKVAQPLHRSATTTSRSSAGSTNSLHRTLTMTSRGSPSPASENSSQSVDGPSNYFEDAYIYPAQPIVAPLDPIASSPFAESRGHTEISYDGPRSAKNEGFVRVDLPMSPTDSSYDAPRVKGLNISRVGMNGERPPVLMPEPTIGTP